ncbi:DedA family protein [Spectribacter hydrogenoxidans]|uniref:DedA family protein n=1 Tax=Spectribacter hydrogenoxidans TaxID=3075608 RepID=A0ABU3BW70_9GAMM|nr:DedA family protein [Salinisphaera sp. W335]MDT0633543.1 DedA family protein [Salinisphaera sp. W335]
MLQWLQELIIAYGYLAVAIGCFFEGETSLLLGAIAAQQEVIWFPGVLLAGLIGTVIGDNAWFYLGRYTGKPFIARRPRWKARARYAGRLLDRYGAGLIIGLRFFYGLRSVMPFVIGAARVSPLKFFIYDFIGTLIWLTVIGLLMYFLGSAVGRALTALQSDRGGITLLIAGLVLFAVFAALFAWRVRLDRRVRRPES